MPRGTHLIPGLRQKDVLTRGVTDGLAVVSRAVLECGHQGHARQRTPYHSGELRARHERESGVDTSKAKLHRGSTAAIRTVSMHSTFSKDVLRASEPAPSSCTPDASCSPTALIWPYVWLHVSERTVLTDWKPHMSVVVRTLSLCGAQTFVGTRVHAERWAQGSPVAREGGERATMGGAAQGALVEQSRVAII